MAVDPGQPPRHHLLGRRRPPFAPIVRAAVAMNAIASLRRPIGAFTFQQLRHHRPRILPSRHAPISALYEAYCTSAIASRDVHHRPLGAASQYTLELCIPTPDDMEDVGGLLSVNSSKGDVILLDGDLGAGKTCFSRGFVRARTGREDERVTSPTYLLSNAYAVDGGEAKVYHMDLYRLSGKEDDLAPLDLENVFANHISLVEWPSRLREKPPTRLEITLTIESTTQQDDVEEEEEEDNESKSRRMKLVPHGDRWVERLQFLESEGYFEDLIVDSSG